MNAVVCDVPFCDIVAVVVTDGKIWQVFIFCRDICQILTYAGNKVGDRIFVNFNYFCP